MGAAAIMVPDRCGDIAVQGMNIGRDIAGAGQGIGEAVLLMRQGFGSKEARRIIE